MSNVLRIATTVFVGCLILAVIIVHIKYMCWERGYFAVGGEWIVYAIAAIWFGWWVIGDDD